MSGTNVQRLERTLKALANKRRLTILHFIKTSKRASVGDVAEHINLSFKSTSRHLSVLAAADILESEQRGLNVLYRLNSRLPHGARQIITIL
jgi:DNA-binding transcriptional ArsR family regulator